MQVCEKCFFCKSLCLCPKCVKCPQCCKCSISGGTPTKFLENMGSQGCKPKSSIHIERGLCASLQSQTSLNKGTPDSKQLCKPHQRLPLTRSCTSSDQEKGSRAFESHKRTNQPGPGRGGFAGTQKKQHRYQPYSTWKQEDSGNSGAPGKEMPAWKAFGNRGRARGRGRGGQPGRGSRPAREAKAYK